MEIRVSLLYVENSEADRELGLRQINDRGIRALIDYGTTSNLASLNSAVADFRAVAAVCDARDPLHALSLADLGHALWLRHHETREVADLDEAVEKLSQAASDPSRTAGDSGRRSDLLTLALALMDRYEDSGQGSDLDAAIDALRTIGPGPGGASEGEADPRDAQTFVTGLAELGKALLARATQATDPARAADLAEATAVLRRSIDLTAAGDRALEFRYFHLAQALDRRYEDSRERADGLQAVRAYLCAAAERPGDMEGDLGYRKIAAYRLEGICEESGDEDDNDALIELLRDLVVACGEDDEDLPDLLLSLASALRSRFGRAGQPADIDEAVRAGRRTLAITRADNPDRAEYLEGLALSLRRSSESTLREPDLDEAVGLARESVKIAAPDDPELSSYFSTLGTALIRKCQLFGSSRDLDDGIQALRQALSRAGDEDVNRIADMANLGEGLKARCARTGQRADADEAVATYQAVMAQLPEADPWRPVLMSGLGQILLLRHLTATAQNDDLDGAVDALQKAAELFPPSHPGRSANDAQLAAALSKRSDRPGRETDLDEAIAVHRRNLATMFTGDPNRVMSMSMLGLDLLTRSRRKGRAIDLDDAADIGREAVAATPDDDPRHSASLLLAGYALHARYLHGRQDTGLAEAIDCWQRAAASTVSSAAVRITAAQEAAEAAAAAGLTDTASEVFTSAVRLLPELAWHGLERSTQQAHLASWTGLAADAAATAIKDSRPELAVENLEHGRSVLWTQMVRTRTDLSRLAESMPRQAATLSQIRSALDTPGLTSFGAPAVAAAYGSGHPPPARQELNEERMRLAREWDSTLAEVRSNPQYQDFLLPTPYSELRPTAGPGTIAIINVSKYGCHALLVSGNNPLHVIALPQLSHDDARARAHAFLAAVRDATTLPASRPAHRDRVFDLLGWLWDTTTAPVLAAITDLTADPARPAPRVWWCPTGPLTFLPLHAAGRYPRHRRHDPDPAEARASVLDQVISSYTPTIATLARARRRESAGREIRQLTVAVPAARGHIFTEVARELSYLASYFPPPQGTVLTGSSATRTAVKAALGAHPWFHLACHASQDISDPSRSAFQLFDGPLTIADLSQAPGHQEPRDLELAYLSACETASGDVRLAEEAVHLAAALQLVGYRHIIATMWPVADVAAARMTEMVYPAMLADGRPTADLAATALHQAVRQVRSAAPADPLSWAPFIHLGP